LKNIIYQLFPRYWGSYDGKNVRGGSLQENGCGHLADIDDASLAYLKSLGVTHVWYTGLLRHATSCDTAGCTASHPQFVKGNAGSPYAIRDYMDINPYLADNPAERMAEFSALVGRTHKAGMKFLMDFVPNHVSRDNVNFGKSDKKNVHWDANNDFFYYPGCPLSLPVPFNPTGKWKEPFVEYPAKASGNNCFKPDPGIEDWYETVKLNICDFHTPTWDKFLEILRFWADKGVDGFRCDMVELVPPEFLTWLFAQLRRDYPELIFIGEAYNTENYRKYIREVGFNLLYDKSGMYDLLYDIVRKNVFDSGSAVPLWQSTRRITACWQNLGDLQADMLNFLENHDEVRLSSRDFAGDPRKGMAALGVSLLFNNASFMMYAGQEVGERADVSEGFSGENCRSTIFDWWSIPSLKRLNEYIHQGKGLLEEEKAVLERYRSVLALAQKKAFRDGMIYDLCFCNTSSRGFDPDRHFAFLRYEEGGECYLVACNFSAFPASMDLYMPTRDSYASIDVPPYDFSVSRLC